MIDIRYIKDLHEMDRQRIKELSQVIIKEQYLNNKTMPIDSKLDLLALKHGWRDYHQWLDDLYNMQGMSLNDICDITNVSTNAIKVRLNKQGVKLRSKKESIRLSWARVKKKKKG
jgi:methyl coenzyme M reductase subunit C-like uncharacterized protein (methanogenesis marker protein 7)